MASTGVHRNPGCGLSSSVVVRPARTVTRLDALERWGAGARLPLNPTTGLALLPIHIIAALLAIAFGAVALSAAKGSPFHRRSGTLFVYAMLVMSGTGTAMGVVRGQPLNTVAGGVVFYLVTTGLLTVLPATLACRRLASAALLAASTLAVGGLWNGIDAIGRRGQPFATMLFIFGAVAGLGAWGDWRMLTRGIGGGRRIARHLWRMGLAMLITTLALPRVLPDALHMSGLLAIPVVLVLLVVLYWLARVLITKRTPRT